jgi:hypothetical protein
MGIINSEQINLKVNVRTCFRAKKKNAPGFLHTLWMSERAYFQGADVL